MAPAATRLVSPDEYETIQEAIDAASEGDEIIVSTGTYYENINFDGKNITLRSTDPNDPNIVATTIIDGNDIGSVVTFENYEDANCVLSGFTIINGEAPYMRGGGVYCSNSSPTIMNCVFSGNSASSGGGGGMRNYESSPILTNCTFIGNGRTNWGGGMYNNRSSPILTNCTFTENHAYDGGGMYNYNNSNPTLDNCIFSDNKALSPVEWASGGGMYNNRSSPILTNCTFSWNFAVHGSGMFNYTNSRPILKNCIFSGNRAVVYGGGMHNQNNSSPILTNCTFSGNKAWEGGGMYNDPDSNPILTNCIFWGNIPYEIIGPGTVVITYSNVQGGWPGLGNIYADPCFVEPGYWSDRITWVNGDYHLLPDSPCIDAGTDANVYTDIEGNIRPFDFPGVDNNEDLPEFDMGAYEATIQTEAELMILPRTINRHSRMKKILALVRLPADVTEDQIDSEQLLLLYPGGIEPAHQYVVRHGRKDTQRTNIFAFFDKAELVAALDDNDNGTVRLQLFGLLTTGRYFHASDTIRIIDRRRQPQHGR